MTYVLPRQNYPFGASLGVYLGHLPDQRGFFIGLSVFDTVQHLTHYRRVFFGQEKSKTNDYFDSAPNNLREVNQTESPSCLAFGQSGAGVSILDWAPSLVLLGSGAVADAGLRPDGRTRLRFARRMTFHVSSSRAVPHRRSAQRTAKHLP